MLTKKQILTPALLLDLNAFEANLARMLERVNRAGKALRPHFKAHKCTEIAKRQIAAGACGICVATLAEAELAARAGIANMLLTSPLADPAKMTRVVATGAMVVADHEQQVEWYQAAALAADRTLDLLVDLDVGDHRTGARDAAQGVKIAEAADRASHLKLRGIQAYSVLGSHAGGFAERKEVSRVTFERAVAARDAMAKKGLSTEILTGGSTGTWDIDTEVAALTELQAGSFVLMDMAYRREGLDFQRALTVMGTVVSANHAGFVSLDCGTKSFSTDRGYPPEAVSITGSKFRWGGDEFGYLDVEDPALLPRLGDRVEFIPPHCDPTVNLYDTLYACRGENVEAVWGVKRLT
jgi:3-hydroxy-D-aspartate aldolase